MADIIRIVTEQAPSAKPISSSLVLTTSWQTIINVPEYDIPVVGFGQSRRIAPGVAEISSPMLISNTSSSTARVGIRVIRNFRPLIVSQTQVDYGINFPVTNDGAGSYVILGENNPTITLVRGNTYYFSLDAPGHPFWIKTAPVTGTNDAFNDGVTNNGIDQGVITFTVPLNAPDTLFYICQFHGVMTGEFIITNDENAGSQGIQGNGEFSGGENHEIGDTIELSSGAQIVVDQVDANGQVTEFIVASPGLPVARRSLLVQADSSGSGEDFSLTVGENNQSQTQGIFFLVNNFPVEASDTQVVPLNGQFFQTGDRLQVISDTDNVLHATISFTEGQAEEDDLPSF